MVTELLAPAFVGGIPGGPELVVILLIAILLFGANKIPKLARSSGEAIGEFQKGREQVEQELEEIRDGAGKESENSDDDFVDTEPVTSESTDDASSESTDTASSTSTNDASDSK